jgi:hypothetical protein
MGKMLFGVELWAWGVICLGVAATYWFLWPKAAAQRTSGWQWWVLRAFHSLVWLFLALACFTRAPLGNWVSNTLALCGVAAYVIFIYTLATIGRRTA